MKKFNTSPISGAQELLPALQQEFDRLKVEISRIYKAHGFLHIETPVIDRTEILLAKAGGDTEKQIYKIVKTSEDSSSADQALRFDHTVPLARYVVEHSNDLTFPFKVTQVARNFRGERAQRGRFREFYQCDVDVIGWNTLSVNYDAEVIAVLSEALKALPLPGEFRVRVNNRKIIAGLVESLSLTDQTSEILDIIDHAEKVPLEKTRAALLELTSDAEKTERLLNFINLVGPREEVVKSLKSFGIENQRFQEGVKELEQVLSLAETMTDPEVKIVADMKIVRGLDYYTGTVFETMMDDYPEIGSICSGGRYDNLASNYTDQSMPGVGGSIGLTRLFFILREYGAVEEAGSNPVDYCLIPMYEDQNILNFVNVLANKLRRANNSVDIVLSDKRLGDQMKYASKIANFVAVIGEDELESGKIRVKNLTTGTTKIEKFYS